MTHFASWIRKRMRSNPHHSRAAAGTAVLTVIAFTLSSMGFQNPSGRAHPKRDHPLGDREVDFPYYSIRDGFDSTLRLVNDSPKPIDFSIIIHNLSGRTAHSSTLTIQPQETIALDLGKFFSELKVEAEDFTEGSVSIRYQANTMMPLLGQITIANPDLHLTHEAYMVQNNPDTTDIPAMLNTMWWSLGPNHDPKVAISNTSDEQTAADLFLDFQGLRHTSPPLYFAPHETKVLSVTKLLADLDFNPSQIPEGGITIMAHGPRPVLIAQGWILDASTGFSTTLDLPSAQKPNTLYASGVPIGTPTENSPYAGLGTFTPHVIIRNLSDSSQEVAIVVEYPGQKGTEETSLPSLSLPAYSTTDLSVDPTLAQLSGQLPYSSFRITYSGPPASAIAQLSSVDEKGDFVVDSRVINERLLTRSGANPWHLDEDTESVLFLTNTDEKEVGVPLQVYAEGVMYRVTDTRLKPHETRAIDLRKLRDEQKPDAWGHRISADAKDGVIFWLGIGEKSIAGRLVVFHRSKGIASNFDCGCQCGDFGGYRFDSYSQTAGATTLAVGATTNMTGMAVYDDCNSNYYCFDVTSLVQWGVSPPSSVATVNSAGQVTAQGSGQVSILGQYGYCYWTYDPDNGCQCPFLYFENASTTINVVQVQVTKVDISNDEIDVTLQGPSGISGTLTVTWNGPSGNANIANLNEGPGTYTFNPSLGNLVVGQYTGVTAQWLGASNTSSNNFNVLGNYQHTQYNSPAESQCSGATGSAYLTPGPSACTWNGVNLVQQFITQAWINGSGYTNNYGACQEYLAGCSPPTGGNQNYFRQVSTITPGCGSPNNSLSNTSVAIDVFSANHPLKCGDQILIVGLGSGAGTVKTATDSCPACNGAAHVDDYNTSTACSLPTLGNYQTIRINR